MIVHNLIRSNFAGDKTSYMANRPAQAGRTMSNSTTFVSTPGFSADIRAHNAAKIPQLYFHLSVRPGTL